MNKCEIQYEHVYTTFADVMHCCVGTSFVSPYTYLFILIIPALYMLIHYMKFITYFSYWILQLMTVITVSLVQLYHVP